MASSALASAEAFCAPGLLAELALVDLQEAREIAHPDLLDWMLRQGRTRALRVVADPRTLHAEGATGRARVNALLVLQLDAVDASGAYERRGLRVAVRGWTEGVPGGIFEIAPVADQAVTRCVNRAVVQADLDDVVFDDAATDQAGIEDSEGALTCYADIVEPDFLSMSCAPCVDEFVGDWSLISKAVAKPVEGSFAITARGPSILADLHLARFDGNTADTRIRLTLENGPDEIPAIEIAGETSPDAVSAHQRA